MGKPYIPGLVDPYLGGGVTRRRGGAAPAAWTPNDVPSADQGFWLLDTYTDTSSDGDADTWHDEWGTNDFTSDTAATSPQIADPDNDYTTGKSLDFNEAGLERINASAASVCDIHKGNGGTIGVITKPLDGADTSQVILSSMNRATTGIGIHWFYNGSAGTVQFLVGDGSGTYLVDYTTSAAVVAANAVHTIVFQFKNNGSGDDYKIWVDDTEIANGTIGATPSASDADGVLRIGARSPSLSWYYEGTYAACLYVKNEVGAEMSAYLETLRA